MGDTFVSGGGNGYNDYVYTDQGSLYTSGDRAREASDIASTMMNIIKNAQRRGGFSPPMAPPYDFENLITNWEQIGTILRSPNYHGLIAWAWLKSKAGANMSQALLEKLNKLRNAVYGDTMARILAFNDAQEAMLDLVEAYRAKLGTSDKEKSDKWLLAWRSKTSAQIEAGPGD